MRRIFASLLISSCLAGCGVLPQGREPAKPQVRSSAVTPTIARPEVRACQAQLGRAGSRFSPLPDRVYGQGCSTLNSVKLEGLAGDISAFSVTNLGPLNCPLANGFAAWARYGVDRAARQILGSKLVRIETMGSYACRNVAGTNRLSAHAKAEAIDVSGFVLADGRRITITQGWNASPKEREFLRVVHRSACKRFGTVLGPDYNRAHRDHLHMELGDGSFCR